MEKRVVTNEINEINIHKWIKLIKKHKDIKTLDKENLNELISKVYVQEKEIMERKKMSKIKNEYSAYKNEYSA